MKNPILKLTLATAAIVPSLLSYAYDRGPSRYAGDGDEDDLDAELDDARGARLGATPARGHRRRAPSRLWPRPRTVR